MPITHLTKVFGVKQLNIAKLLTDPLGAPPTYSTSVRMTGAKSMEIAGAVQTKYLRGDNALMDADTVIQNVSAKIRGAKFNSDILTVVLGSSITDTGVTPNQVSTMSFNSTSAPSFFKIEGQAYAVDTITGDLHFVLFKCKIDNFPTMGLMEEDYRLEEIDVTVMPTIGTPAGAGASAWIQTVYNETAVAPV